eukprot:gene15868-biopygen278
MSGRPRGVSIPEAQLRVPPETGEVSGVLSPFRAPGKGKSIPKRAVLLRRARVPNVREPQHQRRERGGARPARRRRRAARRRRHPALAVEVDDVVNKSQSMSQ